MRSAYAAALLALVLVTGLVVQLVAGSQDALNQEDVSKDSSGKPGDDPKTHGKPDHPKKPGHPGKPDHPDDASHPDIPDHPEVPGKADDEPGDPDTPDLPGKPDEDPGIAEELLAEAEEILALALEANRAKKFRDAADLAVEAERLANLAMDKLLSTPGTFTEQEAQGAIDCAEDVNVLAAANLSAAETNLVDTESLKRRVHSAKRLLETAQNMLEQGHYAAVNALAAQAKVVLHSVELDAASLADGAEVLLEELEEMEIYSPGVRGSISFSPESLNTTVVEAEGHSVVFSEFSPHLTYAISGSRGKGGFEANVFALIEFSDMDGDNEVDEGEIVRAVQLDELEWVHGRQETSSGTQTCLEVWYRYESPEFDLLMLMTTFEAPVIKHFSSVEGTVMYLVDGNARDTKLDLQISRWPWSNPTNKLAIRVHVAPEEDGEIELRRVGMNEEWIVVSSGESSVRVKAVTKAEIQRLDDLSWSLVDVDMSYRRMLDGGILVDFVYPNFGENILYHDPQFGIGGVFAYEPLLSMEALAFGLAILAVALVANRRSLQNLRIRTI